MHDCINLISTYKKVIFITISTSLTIIIFLTFLICKIKKVHLISFFSGRPNKIFNQAKFYIQRRKEKILMELKEYSINVVIPVSKDCPYDHTFSLYRCIWTGLSLLQHFKYCIIASKSFWYVSLIFSSGNWWKYSAFM